jgi:Piwi domain
VPGDFATIASAAIAYRNAISEWNSRSRTADPKLALVLVPRSERWETERPYYEAKAAFARLGVPTQMVTAELLDNEREFSWSVANIALAVFAKLGGIPWVVESPPSDNDLIIGVGRSDIRGKDGVRRSFGYALSFTSNGVYRQTWSFSPVADEDAYSARLQQAIEGALRSTDSVDEPFDRLVIHLGKKTGRKEASAAKQALAAVNLDIPIALLRLDDTSLYDVADGRTDTFAPPNGILLRIGQRQALLQTEGLSALGPPYGPLLMELDTKSDVSTDRLDDLAAQTFRLAHANWRGFNARSQPVTLVYGEILARLVGYLEEVPTWDATLLRNELRDRPWFL